MKMNVSDVRKAKSALEAEIKSEIERFEIATGCEVLHVDLTSINATRLGDLEPRSLKQITLDIRI